MKSELRKLFWGVVRKSCRMSHSFVILHTRDGFVPEYLNDSLYKDAESREREN